MKCLLRTVVVLAAVGFCATLAAFAEPSRPNILVIFTDDHGWADLGAQEVRKDIRTPNLDALASGGLRAISGYVTAPQCVPSRAGLLSGRYQNRFGVESNAESVSPFAAERTIAERLKEAGYVTGMAGKWHLGDNTKITEHGFDRAFFKHSNAPGFWNMDLHGEDIEPVEQRGGGYHLDLIADFACAFIRRHAGRPFFFYFAPRAPHTPLDAPPKYTSRFPGEMPERRRQALAMISAVDDGVGRILATLREHKLEDRTLIFVMGDNGAPLKIHKIDSPLQGDPGGRDGSLNEPMNGEKGTLCEGGVRTPWLAYWKGTIPAGQAYPHPVISLDVAATAVALAGVSPPAGELDGVNLIPFFIGQNKTVPHERLFWRWTSQSAIREGKWKLLRGGPREYLYDLEADPGEKHNLIGQHPDIAKRLRDQLMSWGADLKPPGVQSAVLSPAATAYFDYYLDGKPAVRPEPNKESVERAARRAQRKEGRRPLAAVPVVNALYQHLRLAPGSANNREYPQQMKWILVIATAIFALKGSVQSAAPSSRLNIVLFLIDDLGWKDLGCQGSTYYRTPNIDRLAREGARFTDAYAACAVCSPTRAAILTGKYPARLLLTDWLPSGRWNSKAKLQSGRFLRALPLEEFTLAEALREAGYRTASIGKWHLGSEPFSLPEHHGFDVNIAGNAHGAPGNYFFPYDGDWLIPSTGLRAKWNVLADGKPGEYLTDRLTDEGVKFIRENRDRPFFLYFPHYGVHTPLQAKKEMIAKYEEVPEAERQGKPEYAAMIESVDESVGRVLTTLKELRIEQNTLVIFTSDNGGFFNATSNKPLRANKGAYYEGGIRVPLIIKWPGVTQPGWVRPEPVTSTDLYPTCLAAAGVPLRPSQHLDGLNLQPLFTGAASLARKSLFWHFPHYNEHPSSVPSSVVRRGPWKLIETFDPEGLELYDLAEDLGETTNLAASRPGLVSDLRAELNAWRKDVGAEMMRPNPDYDPNVQLPTKKKKGRKTIQD